MSGARGDIAAGRSYVSLYVKRSAFDRALQQARQNLSQFGSEVMAIGQRMLTTGAALAIPFAFAAKKFAEFDDAMRAVKGVTGATEQQLQRMTDVAKELGRTTSFTAVEVGKLMTELGRAGFKPDDIESMTGAVLDLARATGTDATLASGIMAATIRQFNLTGADAAKVADSLTAAANNSFTTVEQLGEALSYAGPVADDFNVSLEEALSILGGLGNVGIQASNAGTTLRRLFTLTGAEAAKLHDVFGVEFVDAAGNARPLVDVLEEVNAATKDLGTAARAEKFNEAFGLLGITGASAIGKNVGSIRDLQTAIEGANGTAKKTAEEMDAGLGGTFRKVSSAAEGLVMELGDALAPMILGVSKTILNSLAAWTLWIKANHEIVAVAATAVVSIAGTGAALVIAGATMKATAMAMGVMAVAFKAGAAAVAIAGFTTKAFEAAVLATTFVLAAMTGTATGNTVAFAAMATLQSVYPAVAAAVTAGIAAVSTAITASAAAAGAGTVMSGIYSAALTALASVATTAWGIILAPITPFVVAATLIVGSIASITAVAGVAAVRAVDFAKAWDSVRSMAIGAFNVLKQLGDVLYTAFSAGDYASIVKVAWIGIRIAFWEGAAAAKNAVMYLFTEAGSIAKNFFSKLLSTTGTVMKEVALAFLNPFGAQQRLGNALADLANTTFSIDLESNANAARIELDKLQKQLKSEATTRDVQTEFDKETKALKAKAEAAKAGDDAAYSAAMKQKGLSDEQIAALQQQRAELENIEAEHKRIAEAADTYDSITQSMVEQSIALQNGADAAERYKLQQQGLNDEQIRNIEVMRAQLDMMNQFKDQSKNRIKEITDAGDRMLEKGASPQAIKQQEEDWIQNAFNAGAIDRQSAEQAFNESQDRMMDRVKKLKGEAARLQETLKSPEEKLNDKMAKINQLWRQGNLTDQQARDATNMARKELGSKAGGEENGKLLGSGSKMSMTSVATFSARAAIEYGRGGSVGEQQLRVAMSIKQQLVNGNTLMQQQIEATKNVGLRFS